MCIKRLFLALALFLGYVGVTTAAPENITDGELALMPAYCQDVQGIKWGDQYYNPSPRAGYWVGLMGKSFWAMHHYCWGMIHIHRAKAAGVPPQIRDGMIASAISDYYYVIKNSTPGFVMLPEIYVRVGEAEVLRRNPVGALEAFATARELKADYWPPYVRGAEVLERLGKKADARSLLEEGLKVMPGEPALQGPFERLGGKVSNVQALAAAPVARAASEPESPASAAQ
jgi:hypothetical protein